MIKWGGVATAVVATATAACGLLMLSGAGPAPAAADNETVPEAPTVTSSTREPAEAEPVMLAAVADSSTTTTTTTATTTTPAPASPVPLSVGPQSVRVGAGGTARISGECPVVDGSPLGPVEIWQIGSTVTPIATGVTAAAWSYDWTAPTAVEPLVLQVWCGDPSQYEGGYPESLQIDVVFVDQAAPTTTTTVAVDPGRVIPETD